jgi:hypothetical protein
MEIVSACALPVGWIVWQARSGAASLTVVCKATYALAPVSSPLADDQDPLNDADRFWNDDPRQALLLPGDMAPFKRRADVLLTGHAYAPRGEPTRSLVARLLVGEVDKAIEVFADRAFTAEGQLREGPRFVRSPLVWQVAAGGPDSVNPVGIRGDATPDRYGQRALPRLQPAGLHITGPEQHIPPVGFGPISPLWPERQARLGRHAATWDRDGALPDDIDAAYFNAATADQQVESIRSNERIVLENLDPEHPRLVTNLVTATPRATVEWASRPVEDVGFRCDTLWIDTDRRRCSLTWRAAIPLLRGEQPSRVTLRIGGAGAREESRSRPGTFPGTTTLLGAPGPRPVLPFQAPSAADSVSPPPPATVRVGSSLSGSMLGGLRLGAPAPAIAPLPTPDLDLDAETIDGTIRGFADEETQDRWEPPPATVDVMPFAAPSRSSFATPDLAPAPQPVWLPGAATDAPPAPPPMLGPLATSEMSVPVEDSSPPETLPAPAPAPEEAAAPPAPEVPAVPIDRFPIDACARIAASIARRRAETGAILGAHEIPIDGWAALEKHWAEAVSEGSTRGKTALLRAYDDAYVAQLEEERGPITPTEYARLVVAVERGRADVVLGELDLPRGAILRIQRVWLNRFAADAAFNKSVRAAMAAETEGEE